MEERTFGGLVAEVEKAVRPLGFSVVEATHKEKISVVFGGIKHEWDEGELNIALVRRGKLG